MTNTIRQGVMQQVIAQIHELCSGHGIIPIAYSDLDAVTSEIRIMPVIWFDSKSSPDLLVFFRTEITNDNTIRQQALLTILAKIHELCIGYGLKPTAYSDLEDLTSEVKINPLVQLNSELHPNLLVFFHFNKDIEMYFELSERSRSR